MERRINRNIFTKTFEVYVRYPSHADCSWRLVFEAADDSEIQTYLANA